jgi:hypothetical protein
VRIGLDFDNTIVSYDALFHRVALEQQVVPATTPANKVAVRDHLRAVGQEERWTLMQGEVYGARMDDAVTYPGVIDFLVHAGAAGHDLFIVSHKTRHPILGPAHDLHAASRRWLERNLLMEGRPLIPPGNVYFELTRDEKLARIAQLKCDMFVDDLPEVILAAHFPSATVGVLFDPEHNHGSTVVPGGEVVGSWSELRARFDR